MLCHTSVVIIAVEKLKREVEQAVYMPEYEHTVLGWECGYCFGSSHGKLDFLKGLNKELSFYR